jgi:hypothetical protein
MSEIRTHVPFATPATVYQMQWPGLAEGYKTGNVGQDADAPLIGMENPMSSAPWYVQADSKLQKYYDENPVLAYGLVPAGSYAVYLGNRSQGIAKAALLALGLGGIFYGGRTFFRRAQMSDTEKQMLKEGV